MKISRENMVRLQAAVGLLVIFGAFFVLLAIAKAFRTYEVYFYDGSTCIQTVEVRVGEKAKRIDATSKDGRSLDKWVTEDGKEFDFETPIKGNLRLYAMWKE